MKQFLAIGLLIVGAAAVGGQTENLAAHRQSNCSMTMARAPVIGGLRLGMTAQQALSLFPGSSQDSEVLGGLSRPASQLGVSSFTIRPAKYGSRAKFAGINQIAFTLLDGHISRMHIGYNGPEWKHVDQFVAKFSQGTNLPAAQTWEAQVGLDTQLKTLRCTDFEISIFAGGKGGSINYVEMKDLGAQQKLKERREKAAGN
jgi:hypothetical protein